ncbi:ATP-binding protein [Alienimonas sp. DA493]|uniref:ATP-binding response regulator n=1 Tax=Alienimonas sp. DA493 TaxID=3373605 RepID=UPI00375410E7
MPRSPRTAGAARSIEGKRLRRRIDRRVALMTARLARRIDRPFATLMPLQWLACVAVAVWICPHPYQDTPAEIAAAGPHPQLLAAALGGGLAALIPMVLIATRPGMPITRHVIGAAQVCFSSLLIYETGGRIESHFHIYLSLAFLAAYRDWRALALPTALVLGNHYVVGRLWPEALYGTSDPGRWAWAEHAFWLLFTDAVLVIGCLRGTAETRRIAAAVAREKAALRSAAAERDAATAADQAKSAFLANMSHEIRTPLNAILGFTDILRFGDCPPEERNEHLDTIRGSGDHLLALINDILDLSKVESGRMTFEHVECDPNAILAGVLSGMRVVAAEKGLSLECRWRGPVPQTIVTDPARLRQVLLNLVGNAVKFTAEGGVRLAAEVVPAPGGRGYLLGVDVFDTGEGIPQEKLDSIFDPFTQADVSVTRRHGGTGLGLSISRQIAEHLGGGIVAASRPGAGSLFRVTVDAGDLAGVEWAESQENGTPSEAVGSEAGPSCPLPHPIRPDARVLLVDDGDVNRRLIRVVLGRAGLTPDEATNGRDALDRALAARRAGRDYDLILMDMQMPVMDGYAAATRLREEGLTTPIVALTAHAMAGDRAKCVAAGCTEYLSKPVRPADLLTLLGELLPADEPAPAAPTPPVVVDAEPTPPEQPPAPEAPPAAAEPLRAVHVLDDVDEVRPPGCELDDEDSDLWPVAAEFLASLPHRLAECRSLLDARDAKGLTDAAHKLAGTAGTLGYSRFTVPAAALEAAAESDWNEAELLRLVGDLNDLSAALRVPSPVPAPAGA